MATLTRERLKELVKEVMVEETEYQQFFSKALEKAGKSIPSMSDEEKKAFFDKIDAAWTGRGEKNEALVGGQKELDVDKDGDIEADDLADLRAGKKVEEAYASGKWVGFTKTPKGKKYHSTFNSGKQAEQWAIKNNGGAMPKSDWDEREAKYAVEDVNEAKVIVYNEKTGERYEVLSGKGKGDLMIAMKALQKAAPSHMKYSLKESVNEENINETKFYAFFNNKKHEIEGNSLWDAKQKAITMLKVPKSKVGYLAIVNAKEHDGGSYRFESVNEGIKTIKNQTISGIKFDIINTDGKIFFKFKDRKDASAKIREIGTTKIVNDIQKSLDNMFGKNTFYFKSGKHAEFSDGYLFIWNPESIDISKLKFNENINELTVTRIHNFNLESNAYIYMLELLKNNSTFKKIASDAGMDLFGGANSKNVLNTLKSSLKKVLTPQIISSVVNKINEKGQRISMSDIDIKSGAHNERFAGLLALGLIDSFTDSPIDTQLIKDLGNTKLANMAKEFSANRGKAKVASMMANKNESVNEAEADIKVGDMIKVVDNPHWEAALGKKGPFKRKVKGIHGDSVFFTDGSNSSMKYVKK